MTEVKTKHLVHYIPTIENKKWVTRNTKNHGGLHRQEEFRKGIKMLEHCAHHFRNPRLFHLCFTGADLDTYQLVMQRFCRVLTAEKVDYRYKAVRELDSEKGLHFHVMIVLGAGNRQTHRFITSSNEDGKVENVSALRKAVIHTWNECQALKYRVNPPRSTSGKTSFLQFNQSNMEMFHEAAEWLSYIYKSRSKPESGTVYFSDRPNKRSNLNPVSK